MCTLHATYMHLEWILLAKDPQTANQIIGIITYLDLT